jgi:hypothetical protein
MTCREFKHSAASHNVWELSRTRDEQVLGHAESCQSCGTWLQKQRTLAVSMQTLQARTAGLEAGANVERALLRAFRQDTLRSADSVLLGVKEGSGSSRPAATPLSTPMALKLSRFFEIGAYVALAAAILVGVFLGVRILRQSSNAAQAQSQVAPSSVEPLPQKPAPAAAQNVVASAEPAQPAIAPHKPTQPVRSSERGVATAAANVTNDDSQSLAEVDYTPMMFCDPLSCAADTQVVRVELPAGANGQDSQPQMADLVVGYDGVVRAARMVK